MDHEIIIIDQTYKYEVKEILDGGVGYVRLMSMFEFSRKPPGPKSLSTSDCVSGHSKYPYRNCLAAKTIKNPKKMESFSKACEPWLGLNMPGVVPLLKLIRNGDETLALMPRYEGNLRTLMQIGKHAPSELLKAIFSVIVSLSRVYVEHGIVHQAIKPENILYCYHNQKLVFELSDWGIANVQADFLPSSEREKLKTFDDFGITPYLAPERFDRYISDIRADIFSLGMICGEITIGKLPNYAGKSLAEQIISGEYYERAQALLSKGKISSLILRMIAPSRGKRLQDYAELLALSESI